MWLVALPVANTPLWQLTQFAVTPACDGRRPIALVPGCTVLTVVDAFAVADALAVVDAPAVVDALAVVAAPAGELTTMPIELRVAVCADTLFLALPPPQLLGLWQPLQSLPT